MTLSRFHPMRLAQAIPLSLRIALIVSPLIVGAQYVTVRVLSQRINAHNAALLDTLGYGTRAQQINELLRQMDASPDLLQNRGPVFAGSIGMGPQSPPEGGGFFSVPAPPPSSAAPGQPAAPQGQQGPQGPPPGDGSFMMSTGPGQGLRVTPEPSSSAPDLKAPPEDDPRYDAFRRELEQRVAQRYRARVLMRESQGMGDGPFFTREYFGGEPQRQQRMAVLAQLENGQQVRIEMPPSFRQPRRDLGERELLWVGVGVFLVTLPLVWLAGWWVTLPLGRLASAAEALGRDVGQTPLAESGPPEVRRAAVAFNRMQSRLLRFLRGRSDTLLAMSHDLKTPITRLQLRAELLPDTQRGPFAADVALLQKRVEEALAFMRGVHAGEPMQDTDVQALAATVVERLQDDSGASLTLSGSAKPLRCRAGQLERVLANLIENALRYGGEGTVDVTLEDTRSLLTLRVRDHGPGVSDTLIPRLTEPFFRVESSRSRDSGGTGLGLAIAKDLVESMGGELLLRNADGGGFEASIKLPRQNG